MRLLCCTLHLTFFIIDRLLVFINANSFFPTVNGLFDSIIPMIMYLMLLNMKLQIFSFINYPVLQNFLLRVLMEICNPKSSTLFYTMAYNVRRKGPDGQCTLCVCVYCIWSSPPWGIDRLSKYNMSNNPLFKEKSHKPHILCSENCF